MNKSSTYMSIEDRINYYLGPIHNIKKVVLVNPVNFSTLDIDNIDNKDIIKSIVPCQKYSNGKNICKNIKRMLSIYGHADKNVLTTYSDITWDINDYELVRNRNNTTNKTIIIKKYAIGYCWGTFYNMSQDIPFDKKDNKIFWRGGSTGCTNRHHLPNNRCTIMKQWCNLYPDIDLGLTALCQGVGKHYEIYKKKREPISVFLNNKYLLSIEGNDCGTGLNWKLSSNSLVMMSKPTKFSWLMEDKLIPDYHYICLKDDYSDLREKLLWCNQHPQKCKQIIKNANYYMEMFKDQKIETYIEQQVLDTYFKKTNQ